MPLNECILYICITHIHSVAALLYKHHLILHFLRINPKSYEDAFICTPDGSSDIYIKGVRFVFALCASASFRIGYGFESQQNSWCIILQWQDVTQIILMVRWGESLQFTLILCTIKISRQRLYILMCGILGHLTFAYFARFKYVKN